MKIFSICIVLLVVFFASANSYAKPLVTTVVSEKSSDGFLLSLSITEKTKYKTFVLKNPDRLVVDIKNASWAVKDSRLQKDVVKKIRHAAFNKDTLRIVLDLAKSVKIRSTKKSDKKIIINFALKKSVSKKPLQKKNTTEISYAGKSKPPFNIPVFKPFKLKKYDRPIPVKKPHSAYVKKPTIIIDAGHGGIDSGTIGKSKIKEKYITLKYAKALKDSLEKTGKYIVKLTRNNDRYINLGKRVSIARKAKGDLLISLHADSHPNPKTRGLSVYTLSEWRKKKEGKKLAKKANHQEIIRGVNLKNKSRDLKHMLIDLVQRNTNNSSSIFAETLVKHLGKEARLLKNTHRSAGFAVLTGADVPSVLLELGYLSNRTEEKLLKTSKYRTNITNGIKRAIEDFFNKNPPV